MVGGWGKEKERQRQGESEKSLNFKNPKDTKGFPCSLVGEESACNAGDWGTISGSERSPGEGNGNPLQYSCLENPTERGAWWATVHGVPRVQHNLATKPPPRTQRNFGLR